MPSKRRGTRLCSRLRALRPWLSPAGLSEGSGRRRPGAGVRPGSRSCSRAHRAREAAERPSARAVRQRGRAQRWPSRCRDTRAHLPRAEPARAPPASTSSGRARRDRSPSPRGRAHGRPRFPGHGAPPRLRCSRRDSRSRAPSRPRPRRAAAVARVRRSRGPARRRPRSRPGCSSSPSWAWLRKAAPTDPPRATGARGRQRSRGRPRRRQILHRP